MEQQEIQTLRALMEYEAARTEPPESFPNLPDIPAGRYTDPRFFELEQAEIFKKSWLFAAHLDEIPEPGCYMKWEQAGSGISSRCAANSQDFLKISACSSSKKRGSV